MTGGLSLLGLRSLTLVLVTTLSLSVLVPVPLPTYAPQASPAMLAGHSRLTGHLCANHLDVHRPKHLGECVLPSGHVTPNLNPHHLSVTPPLTGWEPYMSVHSVLDVYQ